MKDLRAAREFCFQYLFHLQLPIFKEIKTQLQDTENNQQLANSISEYKESTNVLFNQEINQLIMNRIQGTLLNYEALEDAIRENLKNWKIERLSRVDHTNLLLAAYELHFERETAKNIVINEAVEISKKYGTTDSAGFVNGVLDTMAKKLEGEPIESGH